MLRVRDGNLPPVEPWPLGERLDVGYDPEGSLQVAGRSDLPTALVRISLDSIAEDLEDEKRLFLNLREYRAPFHAGLFSAVTYQYGTHHRAVDADYVLDLSLRGREETGWYTYPGLFTLTVLPLGVRQVFAVHCEVSDRLRRHLGTIDLEDGFTDVVWLPLLPLTLVFNALDHVLGLGSLLGLSKSGWEAREKAVLENTVRSAIRAAARLIRNQPERRDEATRRSPAGEPAERAEPPESPREPSPAEPAPGERAGSPPDGARGD